ncbi:hypothetical protein [Geodermatophilus obscurus]|uniref:hypothetical protein n=1 Tax=Geodermatophilus obscurus TaxID=1861 RepID=UPI000945A018|nr:hypothetical protein [Geodermatophilus obscurus]
MTTDGTPPLTRPWTAAELRGWQHARHSEELGAARDDATARARRAAAVRSVHRQRAWRRRDVAMLAATITGAAGSAIAAVVALCQVL